MAAKLLVLLPLFVCVDKVQLLVRRWLCVFKPVGVFFVCLGFFALELVLLKQRRQHSQVAAHLVVRQMKLIRWTNGSLKRCCCSWFWSFERASHWLGWLQRVSSCTASLLGALSHQSGLHPWMPGDFKYPWSRSLSALMIQTCFVSPSRVQSAVWELLP